MIFSPVWRCRLAAEYCFKAREIASGMGWMKQRGDSGLKILLNHDSMRDILAGAQ